MAAGLYIASTFPYAGKNTLALGLGLRFAKEGLNVGYMKPLGTQPERQNGHNGDADAFFIQEVLGLSSPPDLVCPVLANQDFTMRAYSGQMEDPMPLVADAYAKLAAQHELVLLGGTGALGSGRYCGLHGERLARELDLKVLLVDRMTHEVHCDHLLHYKELLGDRLLGVALNAVPAEFMAETETLIVPFLKKHGISVLGVLPFNPLMNSIKVDDLAERLGARVITAKGRGSRMVENFLIGTMQVENFMAHFRRRANAAVIVGGDRADVQLVAIEGACSCLVLTGNLYPNDIILARADAANVPILMTREDTYTTARAMESLLSRNKLRDPMKISQVARLVSASLDFAALRQGLGI